MLGHPGTVHLSEESFVRNVAYRFRVRDRVRVMVGVLESAQLHFGQMTIRANDL